MQVLKQVSKLYHRRSNLVQTLCRERKRSFEQMISRIRFEMHLALNTYNIVLSSMFSQICEWLDLVHSWSYSNLRLCCFLSSSFMSLQSSESQEIRVRSEAQSARNDLHSSTSFKLFITTLTSTSIAVEIRYWCTELSVLTIHMISWEWILCHIKMTLEFRNRSSICWFVVILSINSCMKRRSRQSLVSEMIVKKSSNVL